MLSVTTIMNYEVNHYINIFIFMSLYLQMRCIVVYVSSNNELQARVAAGFALLHFVFKMFLEMKMFWDWQPGRGARRGDDKTVWIFRLWLTFLERQTLINKTQNIKHARFVSDNSPCEVTNQFPFKNRDHLCPVKLTLTIISFVYK